MPFRFRIRWFSFSLRTLFVAVTVLCVWLGWHTSAVRERHAVTKMISAKGGLGYAPANLMFPGPAQSKLRLLLADVPLHKNFFLADNQGFTASEIQRIQRAFPEATVKVIDVNRSSWGDDANCVEPWPLMEDVRRSERRWRRQYE